jgi:hypothetical protein
MAVSIVGAALNAGTIGSGLSVAFGVLAVVAVVAVAVSSLSLAPVAAAEITSG